MIARSVALLVLALQVQPAVLPMLCDSAGSTDTVPCDLPQPRDGPAVTGHQGHGPCANAAFCGLAPAAAPGFALSVVSVAALGERAPLPPARVHATDAPTPLLPPPEA